MARRVLCCPPCIGRRVGEIHCNAGSFGSMTGENGQVQSLINFADVVVRGLWLQWISAVVHR
jgi:hypothetical protein